MNIDIINIITEKLSKYPDIKFNVKDNFSLEIDSKDEMGFPIFIENGATENTIYLKAFHSHFGKTDDENEALLDLLYFALKGIARIKEFSKKGKIYKSILELQNENGEWEDFGATILFNANFFIKPRVKYFQNSFSLP